MTEQSNKNNNDFKLDGAQQAPEINDAGEFFAALSDHVRESLCGKGVSEKDAINIVNDLILHLSKTFHGEKFYIAKNPIVFANHMAAYADLQHMDYKDVDLKYGWSQGYSLKLAQKIRERKQRREQLQFPFNS